MAVANGTFRVEIGCLAASRAADLPPLWGGGVFWSPLELEKPPPTGRSQFTPTSVGIRSPFLARCNHCLLGCKGKLRQELSTMLLRPRPQGQVSCLPQPGWPQRHLQEGRRHFTCAQSGLLDEADLSCLGLSGGVLLPHR